MEIKTKQQISEAVRSWIDPANPERSGNKLAEKSGVSSAYISRIKDGIFEFTNGERTSSLSDAIFNRLAAAIGLIDENSFNWDFISTFKSIQKVCRKSKGRAIRMILDGQTGQGKTHSLEYYANTNDYVVYVKCTQNMTAKDLVEELCRKLKISVPYRGVYNRLGLIEKVVTGKKGYLIIIDEAEVVKSGIYPVIKDISDFVKNKAGLIICGFNLIDKIDRLARSEKPGFPQLRRRFFGNPFYISNITIEDIELACKEEGINNEGAIRVLQAQVRDLDQLVQWVLDIVEWQKANGKKITGKEVIELFDVQVTTFKKAA